MKSKSLFKLLKDLDKPLLIASIALFTFGLLNIVTASSRAAVVNYDVSIYYYFYRQLIFIFLGIIAGIVIIKTDTKYYKIIVPVLFVMAIALNLWALTFDELSGSKNWIDLKVVKLQPSEFSKPIIVALLAILFEKNYRKLRTVNIKHYDIIATMLFIAMIIPAIIM